MGLRFRKSLRIAPGVRLNLTQAGLSTTLGPRGATVNVGSRGTRGSVGLPGTGLSYSQRLTGTSGGGGAGGSSSQQTAQGGGCALLGIVGFIILLVAMCSKDETPTDLASPTVNGAAPVQPILDTRYVSAQSLNCRAEPSASGAKVAGLAQGDSADIVETDGSWSKLRRASGDCWVASSFLSATPVLAAQRLASAGSGSSASQRFASSGSVSRPKSRSSRSKSSKRRSSGYLDGSCPCSGSNVCIGPRGGRYCITSGGNKRYGV
jgi:Protein of unknown function (DUF4236)/Bacterial SH3 domain